MARIFSEGFESGLPHGNYVEKYPSSQYFDGFTINVGSSQGSQVKTTTGRGAYSAKALRIQAQNSTTIAPYLTKQLNNLSELYCRFYFNFSSSLNAAKERFILRNSAGTNILTIIPTTTSTITIRLNAVDKLVYTINLGTWYKVDVYFKTGSTTGAWEVKINNVSIISESNVNTGTSAITAMLIGIIGSTIGAYDIMDIDDVAVNDTTGTKNNSWCGDGSIIALRPKGAGNKTQWTTSQGYAVAEDGTSTTNIEITGHGLTTGDVIYNVTRNAYRQVTVVDANNLTVSSVTAQAQNDIINAFTFVSTIAAGTGTSTSLVVLSGHTLESYDVIVNTTRSSAIRRVISIDGINIYNYHADNLDYPGTTVSSQAVSDSINTYKIKQYAISDHWKTVNNTVPNPQYSNIQSGTLNQIDTFNMEELVADKGLPTNTKIVCATTKIYAKEKGGGSQFQPVLRLNGADYTGATKTLQGGTLEYATIFEDSPDTDTTFTLSEIDSIEVGVKVV